LVGALGQWYKGTIMSNTTDKISGSSEAWDSGDLGSDENYVECVEVDEKAIDEAAELRLISIRLQKSLIEEFKLIAKLNGIGYQTLMRQILKRFADSEIKKLVRDCMLNAEEEAEKKRQLKIFSESEEKKAS